MKATFLMQFESNAHEHSRRPAYLTAEDRITLGEVNGMANQIARWLATVIPADQKVIGLCSKPSLVTGAILFGILKAGKVFLGLDPHYPADRLRHMVSMSGCSIVIADGCSPAERIEGARMFPVREMLSLLPRYSPIDVASPYDANRPAYITFTSGSSGRPKAVVAPISQIHNRFVWMWDEYPFDDGEVCCHRMPLSFIDTLWELLGPVCRATPVAIIPDQEFPVGPLLVDALAKHGVSRLWLLPAAINALLECVPDLGQRLPRLRFWVSTGDSLTTAVVRKFRHTVADAQLFNLYGTSEVWDATWYEVPVGTVQGLLVPIGKAIRNVDVTVVDTELNPTPGGEIGEIAVGGDGLALGYMSGCGEPPLSFLRNVRGGRREAYYLTGDLGRLTAEGDVVFLGRKETIIARRAQRISLLEIEAAMQLHTDVAQCAVTSRTDESGDVIVTACYASKHGHEINDTELMSFLSGYLSVGTLPDRFVHVESFPMTPSGKIDRRSLLP